MAKTVQFVTLSSTYDPYLITCVGYSSLSAQLWQPAALGLDGSRVFFSVFGLLRSYLRGSSNKPDPEVRVKKKEKKKTKTVKNENHWQLFIYFL